MGTCTVIHHCIYAGRITNRVMGATEMNTKHNGFTLLELIVTIAIASILVGLAIPTFTDLIKSSQLTTTNNEVVANLNYARIEAVKRNSDISIMFDTTRSIIVLPANCTNSSCWLRASSPLPNGYTLAFYKWDGSNYILGTGVKFFGNGSADNIGYIKICTPEKKMKVISILFVGHSRTAKDTNGNGLPELFNPKTNALEDVPAC